MNENNDTPTTAPEDTVERTVSAGSSAARTSATVTLTAIASRDGDAAIIRRVLPSADERVERVGREPRPDGTWAVVTVFRCTFASVPQALDAAELLPPYVRLGMRVDATTAFNEREFVLLACYYIDAFLRVDRCRHSFERSFVPLSYDELPRPDTYVNCTADVYYLHRLRELESILGCERVRSIYDLMAAHPNRPGWSDFQLAGAIANLGAERAWRYHEESAAALAAAEAEFESEFNFDWDLAEEQWRRYEAWRAEETARRAEDAARWAEDAAIEAESDFDV